MFYEDVNAFSTFIRAQGYTHAECKYIFCVFTRKFHRETWT